LDTLTAPVGCLQMLLLADADGDFTATQGVAFLDKSWASEDFVGRLSAKPNSYDANAKEPPQEIQALDTDYDNYLITYQCLDIANTPEN